MRKTKAQLHDASGLFIFSLLRTATRRPRGYSHIGRYIVLRRKEK